MDFWDEAVEKTVNIERKALLQPLSSIRKIDAKCLHRYKLAKKTLEKPNSLTPLPLMYLVVNTLKNLLFPKARLAKKTKIANEVVLGTVGDKDRVVAMTLLQQVLMLIL